MVSHLLGMLLRTEVGPEISPGKVTSPMDLCFSNIFVFQNKQESHIFKTKPSFSVLWMKVSAVSSVDRGTLEGPRSSIQPQESAPEITHFFEVKTLPIGKPTL